MTEATPLLDTLSADRLWQAVVDRDPDFDNVFVYGVITTGVYCRPSCPSRRANRENVQYYPTPSMAEKAGFRACRRCHPEDTSGLSEQARTVELLCRYIDRAETMPTSLELAEVAGWSQYHMQRVFKRYVGLTPRRYAAGRRAERVRDELSKQTTVTSAVYSAGYNTGGRFYDEADRILGMSPKAYKKGGTDTRIRFAIGECSLGAILVAQSEKGICSIQMGESPQSLIEELQDAFPAAELVGGDADFEAVVAQVVGLIEHPFQTLDLPLDIRGTAFQRKVWAALQSIPPGQTASYLDVAEMIGSPKSVRAVAQACGANKLAVAIPCHRVIRNDGGLSGYRWGVERKQTLLEREREA
ncbi:bifunctional DNA-binding transcriptional regulator/O6-methylguanine-DNA methyltransferase Ada [Gynuella sunshinyii]|uniref:methylated-DNA--[protein]-cysteine S-methyltransferase n=1 Tax=Gynuella sunshinyii YC6258 TaxID=1445510 RepID=A0A0C5W3C6_9GAMM|nr:bifunctional DNA-binding transcriptional regulator/O6-methylguanine-DNA methyltransferase Ada [Gynuella sunshinyii]AJQ97144.1 adenosine deaminase [Gynuella sunshinyii YC6258]